jgi:histidine triad (HIT) family protein
MKEDQANCVFCKILRGELPRSLIYEDQSVLVFPTLEPVNEGHLLIIPKKHSVYFSDLDEEVAAHIMKIAKKMTAALRKSKFKCEGVNLFLADGEASGQEVFHFHLHVYPRYVSDGWGFKIDPKRHLIAQQRHALDSVANEIRKHL